MPQYFTGHEAIQEQEAVQQPVERSHPLERLLHFHGADNPLHIEPDGHLMPETCPFGM